MRTDFGTTKNELGGLKFSSLLVRLAEKYELNFNEAVRIQRIYNTEANCKRQNIRTDFGTTQNELFDEDRHESERLNFLQILNADWLPYFRGETNMTDQQNQTIQLTTDANQLPLTLRSLF